MPKIYYLPPDDYGKLMLLELLAAQLPAYALILAVSAAELASLQADARAFRYAMTVFAAM